MKIKEITQTCHFCPSAWEGTLDDGRMFYVRYRYGGLTIRISKTPTDNLNNILNDCEVLYSETIGDEFDGVLNQDELFKIMENIGFLF